MESIDSVLDVHWKEDMIASPFSEAYNILSKNGPATHFTMDHVLAFSILAVAVEISELRKELREHKAT